MTDRTTRSRSNTKPTSTTTPKRRARKDAPTTTDPYDETANIVEPISSLVHWAEHILAPLRQVPAPHHRLLLDRLEQVALGEIDRLLILMPPGSAKSTYGSTIFPAWWFRHHPGSSIIAASHTADLSEHFGRRLRNLINEHKSVLGYGLASDNHAAYRFATTEQGEYFATGINGPVIGRRADLILIDDPIKNHADADSAFAREHLWNWYRSELTTRLKPKGRIVLIMTRWHRDDLGGRLLASDDNWHQLRLPALAEQNDPLGRSPGDALWPDWEDAAALHRKRATVGSRIWAAQYQQAPVSETGGLFPVAQVAIADTMPPQLRAVRAWDLAATLAEGGRDPDWTVGVKLARDSVGHCYIIDVVRLRAGPHEVSETVVATARRDGAAVTVGLPQDPGQAGKHQVAWLTTQLHGFTVVASPETGAKTTRAAPIAAQVEAGRLTLMRAPWNAALLDELRDFPHGRKDDQVDALARAFSLLAEVGQLSRRVHVPIFVR